MRDQRGSCVPPWHDQQTLLLRSCTLLSTPPRCSPLALKLQFGVGLARLALTTSSPRSRPRHCNGILRTPLTGARQCRENTD